MQRPVPPDPERPGLPRDGLADRLRPGRRDLRERRAGAAAAPPSSCPPSRRSAPSASSRRFRFAEGYDERLGGLDRKRGGGSGGDDDLPALDDERRRARGGGPRRARRGRRPAARGAARPSRSRAPPPPPARARGPRPAARPASRSYGARVPPSMRDVVEVRPGARQAALEVPSRAAPRIPRASTAPRRTRASRPRARARPRDDANAGASTRRASRRASTSAAPSDDDRLRPRRQRLGRRGAGREPAERRVPLPDRGRVLDRSDARAGKSRPRLRSRYARRVAGAPFTTARRSGVKTSVRSSLPELLRRAQRSAVEARPASLLG